MHLAEIELLFDWWLNTLARAGQAATELTIRIFPSLESVDD